MIKSLIVGLSFIILCITQTLLPLNAFSQVVVVPMLKEVDYQEVCESVQANEPVFSLSGSHWFALITGRVYLTDAGKLIKIVGHSLEGMGCNPHEQFLLSPGNLPEPSTGKKGKFYFLQSGSIAFADWL